MYNLELMVKLSYILIMKESKNENKNSEPTKKEGFFQTLFATLFRGTGPEAEKKRKLKNLGKIISKSKFHAFYKPTSSEIQPPFGKFIYDIYKVIAPAQLMFKKVENPSIYQRHIINYILSDKQLDILNKIDERKILEISKKLSIDKLSQGVENLLQAFANDFDTERANKAENLTKAFSIFKDFVCFDYYLILRKFDSSYKEFSFNTAPRLEKINTEYVIEDIQDFASVAYAITDDKIVWTDLFDLLRKINGKDIISIGTWKKIVVRMKQLQTSRIFDLIIRHNTQNFQYETTLLPQAESIIEPFIDKIENDTRELISNIKANQKEDKANSICVQIFGTSEPQNMHNYVSSFNAVLDKKDLTLLEYTEPLNYLKTFLLDFVKSTIREYYEVVVIRGQWDATLSAPMSNAYQDLLKTSDKITMFDEEFAEEGPIGSKIKTLLPKTAHDAGAVGIIDRVVTDANDTAKDFIFTSTQNLITIGKTVKQLLEDYLSPKPTIVRNWKELEKWIEEPMKTFSVNIYKKIYLFVQLMQTYLD